MKKLLLIGTVVLAVFSAVSCAKKETVSSEVATAEIEETKQMEMVTDDDAFGKELGFRIDTSAIPVPGMARFVIDGKIAQLRFAVEKEGSTPIDVMFRATADKKRKDSLSDFNGEVSEPAALTVAGIPVTRTDLVEGELIHHQYFFEKDGVYCCLVVSGEMEENEFEALFTAFHNAVSK